MAGVAFTVFISCTSMNGLVVSAPTIPGAEFVGNDQCALCHTKIVKKFAFSTHARLVVADSKTEGLSGCEACHGPGSKHVDNGHGQFIVNPSKDSEACFRCHQDKKAEFSLPYHHPVPEGKMSCSSCHDPHGTTIMESPKMLFSKTNAVCAQCHKEQTRTHVFDHPALREGCTTCHAVHGSLNKKMLVENDANLCLKCHAQVQGPSGKIYIGNADHTARIQQRNNCWAAGCHEGVHGSNINDHLRY